MYTFEVVYGVSKFIDLVAMPELGGKSAWKKMKVEG